MIAGGETTSRFPLAPGFRRTPNVSQGLSRGAAAIRGHTPSSGNVREAQRLRIARVTFPQRLRYGMPLCGDIMPNISLYFISTKRTTAKFPLPARQAGPEAALERGAARTRCWVGSCDPTQQHRAVAARGLRPRPEGGPPPRQRRGAQLLLFYQLLKYPL